MQRRERVASVLSRAALSSRQSDAERCTPSKKTNACVVGESRQTDGDELTAKSVVGGKTFHSPSPSAAPTAAARRSRGARRPQRASSPGRRRARPSTTRAPPRAPAGGARRRQLWMHLRQRRRRRRSPSLCFPLSSRRRPWPCRPWPSSRGSSPSRGAGGACSEGTTSCSPPWPPLLRWHLPEQRRQRQQHWWACLLLLRLRRPPFPWQQRQLDRLPSGPGLRLYLLPERLQQEQQEQQQREQQQLRPPPSALPSAYRRSLFLFRCDVCSTSRLVKKKKTKVQGARPRSTKLHPGETSTRKRKRPLSSRRPPARPSLTARRPRGAPKSPPGRWRRGRSRGRRTPSSRACGRRNRSCGPRRPRKRER